MRNAGDGKRRTAQAISRLADVIRNFVKDPGSFAMKKGSRRLPKLPARDKRKIIRKASNSTTSVNQIKGECSLNVMSHTILRVIQKSPHLQRDKLKPAPNLRKEDKPCHLFSARENMDHKWNEVKFYCKCIFMESAFPFMK
jgi:hypothetical protein